MVIGKMIKICGVMDISSEVYFLLPNPYFLRADTNFEKVKIGEPY